MGQHAKLPMFSMTFSDLPRLDLVLLMTGTNDIGPGEPRGVAVTSAKNSR